MSPSFALVEGGSETRKAGCCWLDRASLNGAAFSEVTPSRRTTSCAGSTVLSEELKMDGRLLPNVLTWVIAVSSSTVVGMSCRGLPYRSREALNLFSREMPISWVWHAESHPLQDNMASNLLRHPWRGIREALGL